MMMQRESLIDVLKGDLMDALFIIGEVKNTLKPKPEIDYENESPYDTIKREERERREWEMRQL